MCYPLLFAAASAALSVYGQRQEAGALNKAAADNAKAANTAAGHAYSSQQVMAEQDRQKASDTYVRNAIDAERARATTRTEASGQGVSGNSVDTLINSITAQEGSNASTLAANLTFANDQRAQDAKAIRAQTASRINSAPRGRFNPAVGLLTIGAKTGAAYLNSRE